MLPAWPTALAWLVTVAKEEEEVLEPEPEPVLLAAPEVEAAVVLGLAEPELEGAAALEEAALEARLEVAEDWAAELWAELWPAGED